MNRPRLCLTGLFIVSDLLCHPQSLLPSAVGGSVVTRQMGVHEGGWTGEDTGGWVHGREG